MSRKKLAGENVHVLFAPIPFISFIAVNHSAPRVKVPMDRLELGPVDLGVDLRRGN